MPTNTDPAIYDLPSRPPPPDLEWLDEFVCEGLIVEVLARLESGKEATVFRLPRRRCGPCRIRRRRKTSGNSHGQALFPGYRASTERLESGRRTL